jgi:hypothetical protein
LYSAGLGFEEDALFINKEKYRHRWILPAVLREEVAAERIGLSQASNDRSEDTS